MCTRIGIWISQMQKQGEGGHLMCREGDQPQGAGGSGWGEEQSSQRTGLVIVGDVKKEKKKKKKGPCQEILFVLLVGVIQFVL